LLRIGGCRILKAYIFEIPADNATSSFVKVIENPTPNNPKAMKSSILFGEDKITFINKNGVLREFISEGSGTSTILTEEKEKPRIWKIPNPNELPKNEDDFIATFQIYQKGVVITFKDDNKPVVFSLK
jgi:hypothetical protein